MNIYSKMRSCLWWRQQMETFSALLVLCAGNSPVIGEFPITKANDTELWCFLWYVPEQTVEKTLETASDLRGQRTRYDVTVPGQITRCIWLQYLRYPMERGVCDTITMKSHERHVVLNHQSSDCLFNSVCRSTSKKHQCPHYWPLVRGIHRWLVNCHHKGPASNTENVSIWWLHPDSSKNAHRFVHEKE